MGNFSRDTFDPTKQYTGVRLQQGVPLVDADINELQDVRKYALEQFLLWFVGNGVPFANDGFIITPVAASNDFSIGAGRCLVQGKEVVNPVTLNYTGQLLLENDTLAEMWGVDKLPALKPVAGRTDSVYLDVWEREVDSDEDPDMVNTLIGIETSVRNKREWVVRVAEGVAVPAPPAGHEFYPLASFERAATDASIAEIADSRRTGLKMSSYHDLQQIMADAFGSGYPIALNDGPNTGESQLKVSLREAINALLKGGLPATAEVIVVDPATYALPLELLRLASGQIWLLYLTADFSTSPPHFLLFYDRYDPVTDTWIGGGQLTDQLSVFNILRGASIKQDAAGRVWVVWQQSDGSDEVITYWRYNPTTDISVGPLPITSGNTDRTPRVITDASGRVWVFWHRDIAGEDQIFHSRYDAGSDSWSLPEQRTPAGSDENFVEPLAHSNGEVWAFWVSDRDGNDNIYYDRYDPATDSWSGNAAVTTDAGYDDGVMVVEDNAGDIWVFWISDRSGDDQVFTRRYNMNVDAWDTESQLTTSLPDVVEMRPLATSNGDLWIFWWVEEGANRYSAYYKRKSADGGWGNTIQLSSGDDVVVRAVEGADGSIMVAYGRFTDPTNLVFAVMGRQLIPEI